MDPLPPLSPRARWMPNGIIVAFLALQLAAGLKLVSPPKVLPALAAWRIAPSPMLYPFLEYNMYAGARYAGETLYDRRLVAVHADGHETALTATEAGVTRWALRGLAVEPLLDGNLGRANATLRGWLQAHPDVTGLRIVATPHHLGDDGRVTVLPLVEQARFGVRDGAITR